MSDTPKDDEAKFNETLKRMLKTPPTPHKKDAGHEPGASQSSEDDSEEFGGSADNGREAK